MAVERKRKREENFEVVSAKATEESHAKTVEKTVDEDNDDDISKIKRTKQTSNQATTSEAFSSAVNALLDTHLKAHDRSTPILARSKQISKNLESEKLLAKAKRSILHEKKQRLVANHKTDVLEVGNASESLAHERKLKKIAQKGAIKLFNAISKTQTVTVDPTTSGPKGRTQLLNDLSKDKFLDMVQQQAM